jgi:hypothetical protein
MNTDNPSGSVKAYPVPHHARLAALPTHFGRRMMIFENTVYDLMRDHCAEYQGGYWEFYELSNGGFYMAPQLGRLMVNVASNGYEGEMSADAAGITACLFACSLLSFRYDGDAAFAQHFHWLRDFALDHPEAEEILRACD